MADGPVLYAKDKPEEPGLYVAYINPPVDIKFADKKILMWHFDQWTYPGSDQRYRDTVYLCYGPLPKLELTDDNPPS